MKASRHGAKVGFHNGRQNGTVNRMTKLGWLFAEMELLAKKRFVHFVCFTLLTRGCADV
jgi:hypothetical protein